MPPTIAPAIPDNTTVAITPIATILGIIPIAASVAPIAPNNNAELIIIQLLPEDCFCGELCFVLPIIGG